ncbi:6-phosphogluconolactonase [Aeromicrobium massiliense]|uniref:6-phosphogluconolactonase n=1 Tax=Aeromicrobium massiliense TaxID=1464554 RepID=UPI0003062F57|nr:6-phosphogluconolactonase [Aeromicrobium massiliense]
MNHDVHDGPDALVDALNAALADVVREAQAEGRTPSVVLTGGTIATRAFERMDPDAADWSDVDWYWGDERFVAGDSEDRNERQARESFLDRLDVPEERIHAFPSTDGGLSAAEAADAYAAVLPTDPFDVVLLGVGPDGHVASLFPGFAQLHETVRPVVDVEDSPKPPPNRLTLTFPVLNHTRRTWLVVSGEGKAEAVARAAAGEPVTEVPATGVHGTQETRWFLDTDAASQLPA